MEAGPHRGWYAVGWHAVGGWNTGEQTFRKAEVKSLGAGCVAAAGL